MPDELDVADEFAVLRDRLQRFGRFDGVTADDVAEADARLAERKRLLAEGREATVKLGNVTVKISPRVSVTSAVAIREDGSVCRLNPREWSAPDALPVALPNVSADELEAVKGRVRDTFAG